MNINSRLIHLRFDEDLIAMLKFGLQLKEPTVPRSDEEKKLLTEIQAGNKQALSDLYDAYSGILFSRILGIVRVRSEAEDILQEVFVSIWKKAASYDSNSGSVYSWIITMAKNKSIDRVRSKSYSSGSDPETESLISQEDDPLTLTIVQERRGKIQKVLADLPEEQRVIIHLCFYEGLTHQEASAKLGVPLGTVKTRVRLGLQKLAEVVKESA